MKIKQRATSTQPEVNDQVIYGAKVLPTVRVRLKKSKAKRVLIVNECDFDDHLYVKVA